MPTLSGRRLGPHLLLGLALPILAGAGEDENWQRLRSMPREQRVVLAEKIREFDLLSRAQQAAIRALDEKIASLPPAEKSHYRTVLRRYHLWIQTLPEDQRTQLNEAATLKEKLALMAKFRDGRLLDQDQGPTALLFQLADLRGQSPFEVAHMLRVWFKLGPAERGEIEKLGVHDRMKRLHELSRDTKVGPVPRLTPKQVEATSKKLDADLQTKGWLRNQLKKDSEKQAIDRRRLVDNYYFVANPPKPVTSANLLRFETAMPSWIRMTFDHLTPEEARRRLTILYGLIYPPDEAIPSSGSDPAAPAAKPKEPAKAPGATPKPTIGPPT